MYRAVTDMYEVVKARVHVNGSVTEAFQCSHAQAGRKLQPNFVFPSN